MVRPTRLAHYRHKLNGCIFGLSTFLDDLEDIKKMECMMNCTFIGWVR